MVRLMQDYFPFKQHKDCSQDRFTHPMVCPIVRCCEARISEVNTLVRRSSEACGYDGVIKFQPDPIPPTVGCNVEAVTNQRLTAGTPIVTFHKSRDWPKSTGCTQCLDVSLV